MDTRSARCSPNVGSNFSKLFTLQNLITDVDLAGDGDTEASITCVDIWDGNLYIGTSEAEILHFVQLPDASENSVEPPSFILASRHQVTSSQAPQAALGVQQILLLPNISKACILANNTLSFYTLPELSPSISSSKPINCTWVGGAESSNSSSGSGDNDRNVSSNDDDVVMICAKSRIRLVNIAAEPRKVRDIEYGRCIVSRRQDNLACVADSHSYALLDLAHQQKIPLFPICSLDNGNLEVGGAPENIAAADEKNGQSGNNKLRALATDTSATTDQLQFDDLDAKVPKKADSQDVQTDAEQISNPDTSRADKEQIARQDDDKRNSKQISLPSLQPHVAVASSSEFLVTVGTNRTDPGVGMFVNHEGDIVRSTIEFGSYPDSVIVVKPNLDMSSSSQMPDELAVEGFVLAITHRKEPTRSVSVLEIHPLDPGNEQGYGKEWVDLGESVVDGTIDRFKAFAGLRSIRKQELFIHQLYDKLKSKRLDLSGLVNGKEKETDVDYVRNREQEELSFLKQFCMTPVKSVMWSCRDVYWVLYSPLILQLDSRLDEAMWKQSGAKKDEKKLDRSKVQQVVNSIRGQHPQTELEFLGLTYIRQRAALMLFIDVIAKCRSGAKISEQEQMYTEEALMESQIDPRVVLLMMPQFTKEVRHGSRGIWTTNGLINLIMNSVQNQQEQQSLLGEFGPSMDYVLHLLKKFLSFWRKKKGFGSIPDEKDVFYTVDAALLHVLLILDQRSPKGPAKPGSTRAELNALVDYGVDCFERAVEILVSYKRLYILSRLYQSRKMSFNVLSTWKRIIEGETDDGGELLEGEHEIRKYLTRIKDVNTVTEYGLWLAERSPALGVQVFADDNSRVKFDPVEVVSMLKERAPTAVKDYLEYLVFNKKHEYYVNDLIAYYLDSVLDELERSKDSRTTILQTYESYRALQPPKLTYRQFITDNSDGSDWWENRLRLLQLLGAGQSRAKSYDVTSILKRVKPFEQELVPEMIILGSRQNLHEESLRLLTHDLGDFDTAIRYCLLGGASLFHQEGGSLPPDELPTREEQSKLLRQLFVEFLRIEDVSNRLERSGELLERFGGWFSPEEVLDQLPESWPIGVVSDFFVSALRRLVDERCETAITKSLSGCQSLMMTAAVIEELDALRPKIETAG